jgi:hypothetical protein
LSGSALPGSSWSADSSPSGPAGGSGAPGAPVGSGFSPQRPVRGARAPPAFSAGGPPPLWATAAKLVVRTVDAGASAPVAFPGVLAGSTCGVAGSGGGAGVRKRFSTRRTWGTRAARASSSLIRSGVRTSPRSRTTPSATFTSTWPRSASVSRKMVDSTSRAIATSPSGSVRSARLGRGCVLARAALRLDGAAEGWLFGRARAAVRLGCRFPELRVAARLVCALARLRRAGAAPAERRADDVSLESLPRSPRSSAPVIRPASFAGARESRAAEEIALVIIGTCSFRFGARPVSFRCPVRPRENAARALGDRSSGYWAGSRTLSPGRPDGRLRSTP